LFPDPDAFRLDRQPNPHLAFGWGPHRCLGEPLALLEMRAALDAVLERGWSPRWERALPYGRIPGFVNSVREAWMSRS
jgi:cytochrome P450